ncbi:MAG: MFS transporter [Anaerolineae bacterium]|nr:MFS transporter [Anaerolineae bacterium]
MDQTPELSSRRRRLLIGLYIPVTLLYWISLYLYLPTLPTYTQSKTESLAMVGTILAQYGLWQVVTRLPIGIAADWLGRRKPLIVIGLLLSGVGAYIMGTAGGAGELLVGRAITGLAAATWVPLTVIFSSFFPAGDAVRATSLLTAVGSVGRVMSAGVTGTLNKWGGYSLAFYLAAGVAGLAIVALLPARETAHPPRQPSARDIGRLITRRDVLLPALLSAIGQYATWAVPFGFLPILADRLGADDVMQSILVSLHIGVMTVGSLVAAALSKRIGARQLVYASFLILAVGIAAAAAAPSLPLVFVAQFLIGVAIGISYPVLMGMSIRNVDNAERTTAMGLHQAVYAVGMFAGPWLSGILADGIGLRPMLGVTALGCLILGLAPMRLVPRR